MRTITGLLLIAIGFYGCTKEKPASPAATPFAATKQYTDANIGQLIYDASPALYHKIAESPDRAPTVDVRISHGRIDGIGPPPANDPICAKFACTKCICAVIVTAGSPITADGGGILDAVQNEEISYMEGEAAFNAANDLEGYKYLILANDHPVADPVTRATATVSDDNQYVRIHAEK